MTEMRYYFNNIEITEEIAKTLEDNGAAHVATGASGGQPRCTNMIVVGHNPDEAWMMLLEGPGNHWLQTLEGNCMHCGCMARQHLRKPWPTHGPERDHYVACRGCQGQCHVTPPHGDAREILRKSLQKF